MIWFSWQMWLGVALIFGIIEIATVNFYTIWLAIAAVITAILSVFGVGIPGQILAFSLISLALVMISESVVRKVVFGHKPHIQTNVDRLKGQEATVIFRIDNTKGEGIVKIKGVDWSARSTTGDSISEGTQVIVDRIEGVKVVVHPKDEEGKVC